VVLHLCVYTLHAEVLATALIDGNYLSEGARQNRFTDYASPTITYQNNILTNAGVSYFFTPGTGTITWAGGNNVSPTFNGVNYNGGVLQTGDEAREPTAAEKAAYEASTAPQEYLVPLFDTLIPDSVQIALYQTKQAVDAMGPGS